MSQRWSLGLNLIFFTLFCSHIQKKSAFSRLYMQTFANILLVFFHTGEILISENLMVITIVILVELLLKFVTFLSDLVGMPKNVASKIMWVPLVFELLR